MEKVAEREGKGISKTIKVIYELSPCRDDKEAELRLENAFRIIFDNILIPSPKAESPDREKQGCQHK